MRLDFNLNEILVPGAKIYFVGLGGIAMSAAAAIAKNLGFEVAGADSKELYSPSKEVLKNSGIECFLGYDQNQIVQSKAAIFVLSAGETESNPEVAYIVKNNLPRVSFAELLYELSKNKLRVVVAGTHGKSTTTGLLGHIFKNLDDSSFMAGAVLQNYQSNFYVGDGNYFVFEGDEYKSQFDDPTPKFHHYRPDILVLTNLEFDHPDVFSSLEALEDEFAELIDKMPEDGLIVYNADDAVLPKLVHKSNVSSVSFGVHNEADFKIKQAQYAGDFTTLQISNKYSKNVSGRLLGATEQYKTQLPGEINVYNSLAAIATLRSLGFSQDQIALDMLSYKGVKRRFELVGIKNEVVLIDDYAHHPTAVRETLKAARLRYPKAKIWAIFEPHTFSRTKATLEDLVTSFNSADEVLISEIYPAREKISEATISSLDVITAIKNKARLPDRQGLKIKDNIRLVQNKQEALDILKAEVKPSDVIIVMAVGAFNRLAYELKEVL